MSLATSILTSPAALIRPIVEEQIAANPQISEKEVETEVITWANNQLGNGMAGTLAKPIVDLFIELYLPGIYADVVKQALGTSDGTSVLAAQQAANADPSAAAAGA